MKQKAHGLLGSSTGFFTCIAYLGFNTIHDMTTFGTYSRHIKTLWDDDFSFAPAVSNGCQRMLWEYSAVCVCVYTV